MYLEVFLIPSIQLSTYSLFNFQFQTLSKKRRLSPPVKAPSLEDLDDFDENLLASAASAVAMANSNSKVLNPFLNNDDKDVEEDIRNLLNIGDIPLPGIDIPMVRIRDGTWWI